jgi:hypothetical protein
MLTIAAELVIGLQPRMVDLMAMQLASQPIRSLGVSV